MKSPKIVGPVIMIVGLIVFAIPFLIPLTSTTQGSISVQRVSADKYVAILEGGEPNTQYNLEFIYLGVNMDWQYGGVFLTDSAGSLTTFELTLPTNYYPITFRFAHATTGIATYNTVTIDPDNPPPLDQPTSNGTSAPIGSYATFLGLGTIAIGAVVTAIQSKKLKLPH